jgi:3'(2'), 5'-bisphosphate nucleotidase
MEKELEVAKELGLGAGSILMEYFKRGVSIDWKAPGDPVTVADREAGDLIVSGLRREFPEHAVLCEEEPDDPATRLSRSHVWMIDPMDGTREFIDNREEFAVQIGLVVNGEPVLGVVYQPTAKKLYYAAQGLGAFLESGGSVTPLHVSPEDVAARMTIAESRSHRSARVQAIRQRLRIRESILIGSVGLKIGIVCEGRAQVYVHTGSRTHVWDTCGPEAILREAGGRMTNVYNMPLRYDAEDLRNLHGIVVTNGVIHDRVIQVTQSVLDGF